MLGGVCLAKGFIESDYYEKKEIDSCDKVERLAPIIFLIMITIIYPILFMVNSPESILPFFSDLFSGMFSFSDIFMNILIVAWVGIIIFIISIPIHEVFHAIFFAPFQKRGFKSIKIGRNHIAFYCETKEPIKVKHYIIGLMAPTVLLGIVPAIIAIAIGNIYLLFVGWIMTTLGAWDFMILLFVMKYSRNTWLLVVPAEDEIYYYQPKIF